MIAHFSWMQFQAHRTPIMIMNFLDWSNYQNLIKQRTNCSNLMIMMTKGLLCGSVNAQKSFLFCVRGRRSRFVSPKLKKCWFHWAFHLATRSAVNRIWVHLFWSFIMPSFFSGHFFCSCENLHTAVWTVWECDVQTFPESFSVRLNVWTSFFFLASSRSRLQTGEQFLSEDFCWA